jgi:hypothetical protein
MEAEMTVSHYSHLSSAFGEETLKDNSRKTALGASSPANPALHIPELQAQNQLCILTALAPVVLPTKLGPNYC